MDPEEDPRLISIQKELERVEVCKRNGKWICNVVGSQCNALLGLGRQLRVFGHEILGHLRSISLS